MSNYSIIAVITVAHNRDGLYVNSLFLCVLSKTWFMYRACPYIHHLYIHGMYLYGILLSSCMFLGYLDR